MAELRAQVQEALGGSYALERELGRGGMAVVYLAQDLRHDRRVALKVLLPELAATLGPERFQREIRLAARLQHPHILTVHDSGDAAGRLWFTMPFVEGESLRDRLRRERQLPVDDALRIAREAAAALDYAHRHGVVHRDIKPENILLTADGDTLVADFGIARALGGEDGLTQTGLAIGTPAYMSPEQAAGDTALDARTDLYSLASVLYEMLAGEAPWTGPTAQSIMAKRLSEPAPSVRAVRPTVPPAVDEAIRKALAPVAADRFATAAQFAAALALTGPAAVATAVTPAAATAVAPRETASAHAGARRRFPLAAASLTLGFVLGLGLLFGWLHRHGEASGPGGAKLLAVLPFENLGGADDEYFSDGVTDEVRGKLAALPGLQVTARSSSNLYKKTTKSPQEIGRELGVDYLLTGTVRWEKAAAGNHVRVSPELIQVSSGSTKWQQPFDAALTDVFQVQADVAGQVAQALDLALGTPQRAVLAEKPTTNGSAYDAYLKGEAISLGLGSPDLSALRTAIGFYEQAVALDSGFAQAWAQLSRAHSLIYANGTPSPESERRAREAAERALRLAPNQAAGHLALGDYFASISPDQDRARQAYEAGLRVAPSNADLLGASALVEVSSGKWTEALTHFRRAQALDPRSVTISRRLAYTLIRLRRYPEAMAACDRSLALAPNNAPVLENKAMAYLAQGDLEGARRLIRDHSAGVDPTALVATFGNYFDLYWVLEPDLRNLLLRLTPSAFDDRATWAIVMASTYRLQGDRARTRAYADSARPAFEARLRDAPADAQSHVFLGLALAYLGRKAEAIAEGEKAAALLPITRNSYTGPYIQHQLVRIYIEVGEPEKALDMLQPLLKIPYYLSPGWLRIDPTFDPLRNNPRFRKLVEGTA
jgi:eukaryotic-like serine/threonine-protein kinase